LPLPSVTVNPVSCGQFVPLQCTLYISSSMGSQQLSNFIHTFTKTFHIPPSSSLLVF